MATATDEKGKVIRKNLDAIRWHIHHMRECNNKSSAEAGKLYLEIAKMADSKQWELSNDWLTDYKIGKKILHDCLIQWGSEVHGELPNLFWDLLKDPERRWTI